MMAVKIGSKREVQAIIAKILGTTIENNEHFEAFDELWQKLSPSTLMASGMTNSNGFYPYNYYALFEKDEDAVEFKLKHM